MKIIVDFKNINNLEQFNVNGFILSSSEYSSFNDTCFSLEEIKKYNKLIKQQNKLSFVNIDRIIEEEELDNLKVYIDQLLNEEIDYYIFSDLAILSYFKKLRLTNKLIYDPKTLITNRLDAEVFKSFGTLVAINNELTLSEIKDVMQAGNTMMEVFGFHQMFYSKRKLIKNYFLFKEEEMDLLNEKLIIKEEKRDFEYPIVEANSGTYIYTSYIYSLFKELLELNEFKFIRINSIFLDDDKVTKVINLYNHLLNNPNMSNELYNELLKIDSRIESGFLHKESKILKEEVK